MTGRGLLFPLLLALSLGLAQSAPALAADSITVTPPADAIAGASFSLVVASTTDSSSSVLERVFIRRDDGRPCEPAAAAVQGAVEIYGHQRRATPTTVSVPAQSFVGGLRVCAFLELVPAPQTTLAVQDLVVPVRALRGTIQLETAANAAFIGVDLAVRVHGSSEAPFGQVYARAQQGPCAPLTDAERNGDAPLHGPGVGAGEYDTTIDVMIDPAAHVLPDRICAWLYSADDVVLATAEQLISPSFDGTLAVRQKRFTRLHGRGGHLVGWVYEITGHTTSGSVRLMRSRIVRGGTCIAVKLSNGRTDFRFRCLLKRRPRSPFVVEVTYVTNLDVERTAGRITIPVPK